MPSAVIVNEAMLINSDPTDAPFGNAASILRLAGGGFLVCWSESSANDGSQGCVQARIYDVNGVPAGPQFILNTSTLNTQAIPDAVQLANGNIMVTWQDASGQGGDAAPSSIRGQVYTSAGMTIGIEFLVNTITSGSQSFPSSTLLANGNVMVTWVDLGGSDGNVAGIKGQVIDATGAKIGSEFLVNTNTNGAQTFPNVALLGNGNVIVTWQDLSATLGDSTQSIKGQILDAAGNKIGTEFIVNTETTGVQNGAQVAALANGNFVVTWQDASALGVDTSSSGIKAQMFDVAGNRIGDEFLVNTTTRGQQASPAITAMSSGSFIIAWLDRGPISQDPSTPPMQTLYAQAYNADGTRLGEEFIAHHNDGAGEIAGAPMIADLGDSRFIVTGSVATLSNTVPVMQVPQGLQGNIFLLLNQVSGATSGDDILNGDAVLGDFIDGLAGNDTINGLDGVDVLLGGDGNDIVFGGDGDDTLDGGNGNDTLDGGAGISILRGGADNDRLVLGDDANGSMIEGGTGTDTLVIGGTVTSLASLSDIEMVDFVSGGLTLTGSQFVNGLAPDAQLTGAGTLTVIMDAPGSFLSKLLTFGSGVSLIVYGTSDTDIFKLGNAANTVNAGDGVDQIKGGNLIDIVNGGNGNDKITGAGGADILTGGLGNDVYRYARASDSGTGAAADRITDFAIGGDRLNFVGIDTNAVLAGDQGFAFVGNGAFSGGGSASIRYQDSGANLLVQADVNGDGAADMEVILEGLAGQTLTASSFNLGALSEPLAKKFDVMDLLDSVKPVEHASVPEFQSVQGEIFAEVSTGEVLGLIRYYKFNNVMMGPLEII